LAPPMKLRSLAWGTPRPRFGTDITLYWPQHELLRYQRTLSQLEHVDPARAAKVKPYLDHLLDWDCRATDDSSCHSPNQNRAALASVLAHTSRLPIGTCGNPRYHQLGWSPRQQAGQIFETTASQSVGSSLTSRHDVNPRAPKMPPVLSSKSDV
jgi:hypothetical protein